jgi:GNAT superfamily N-acetyltransferase
MMPSRLYNYVRSRQLEGTYSSDHTIGVWITSALRISRGWGNPKEEDWPYISSKDWPPKEPQGIDVLAKPLRIWHYQRVRDLNQCKIALASSRPVLASFDITKQWFAATGGVIELPANKGDVVGGHSVLLMGYDDSKKTIPFRNSWGASWGDNGHGYLPYDYFAPYMTEAWIAGGLGERPPDQKGKGVRLSNWGVPDVMGGILHGIEVDDPSTDERIGWSFVVSREGYLDVEELFVRPQFRGKGYGTQMAKLLLELRDKEKLPLRCWIPHPDGQRISETPTANVIKRLGLTVTPCAERWASRKALAQPSAPASAPPQTVPSKPQCFELSPGSFNCQIIPEK